MKRLLRLILCRWLNLHNWELRALRATWDERIEKGPWESHERQFDHEFCARCDKPVTPLSLGLIARPAPKVHEYMHFSVVEVPREVKP